MKEFRAAESDAGVRADIFVAGRYPDFSRSSLNSLFDTGAVLINGEAAKPGQKLKTGETVSVDDALLRKKAPAIKLPIIYEDKDIIAIDKPAGILTHSKGALNLEATVASFIKPKITDKTLTGNRAGIVHRLDRGTSGVIITAKHNEALKWLQKQFATRKVKKTYIAIAEGILEPQAALIELPIARNPKKPQTFIVAAAGKPAITEYKVLKTLHRDGKNYSLLELKPLTGRTHQLRVHLAYLGHPVVGDPIYGHKNGELLLHAESLELTLPNRQRQTFEAELPKRIKDFVGDER